MMMCKAVIVDDHILIVHPTNKISKIGFPDKKLMLWVEAVWGQKYGWKLPTIEELEFVYQIYTMLKNNEKLEYDFTDTFWSLTTESLEDKNVTALDFSTGNRVLKDKTYDVAKAIYVLYQ